MEEKYNDATLNRPEGERPIDSELLLIDLPLLIKQIRTEDAWKKNDRNAITAFKTNGLRIVLIAMHAGAEMQTHSAEGIISVQVIDGKIKFNTEQASVNVEEGQLLTLHSGISHSVLAIEETTFLLTMAK
jgi:quercetin dioxygenase-like cupin family protein